MRNYYRDVRMGDYYRGVGDGAKYAREQMRTPLDMVREFREASGGTEDPWSPDSLRLRRNLILEESDEAVAEIDNFMYWGKDLPRKAMLAKELADLVYVVYGAADCLGIDLDRVIEAVHASNMTKIPAEHDANGKVTKGRHYVEPDLSFVEES